MRVALLVLVVAAAAHAWVDVGIDTVLGFEDTMPLQPRAVIRNYGNEPAAEVDVYWTFYDGTPHGYSDSIMGLYFDMRTTETLSLGGYIPYGRDSVGLLIYLTCPGDANPANDTWFKKIVPRVWDVAVTEILAPLDTLDSGVVIWPSSEVANVGTITAHFSLVHSIGGYACDDCVTLLPDERRVIIASESLLAQPGVWTITAWALLVGDMNPSDNVMTDTFWVKPLPGVQEAMNDERGTMNVRPTVLRRLPAGAVVFDAMGRRVLDPKPGVYFVFSKPSAVGREPSAVTVRKVILQR